MAIYGAKEYKQILTDYKKGQTWLNDVNVEIVEGENTIDPMVLLRAYDAEPTIDNATALSSQFVLNKCVRFTRGGKTVLEFVYNGGDLSEKFTTAPYLLDLLNKLCYGLMIKKLTPPSEDSENEEQRSE